MRVVPVSTKTQRAVHALVLNELSTEPAKTQCGIPAERCVEPDPELRFTCLICRHLLEERWAAESPMPEEPPEPDDATWDALDAARLALGRATRFLEVVGRKVRVNDEKRLVAEATRALSDPRLVEAATIVQRGLPLAEKYPDGNPRQGFPLTRKQITYLRDIEERNERDAFMRDAQIPDPEAEVRRMEIMEGRRPPRVCTGTTRLGDPCRANAMPFVDEQRCVAHGSAEAKARNDAAKRRVEALAREIWSTYERRLIEAERSAAEVDECHPSQ